MPFNPDYNYEYLCQSDDEDDDSEFDYQVLNQQDNSILRANEYYEHIILPSDTLQGLCLQYRIKPTKLRQVNRFSGCNLNLAPKKLLIPKAFGRAKVRVQDKSTKDYKIHFIMATYEFMSLKESKSYLEIFEWSVDDALKGIEDDLKWESMNGIASGRPVRNQNIRDNIYAFHNDCKKKNEKNTILEVGYGVPLPPGVNRYVWKDLGIEMKDLSRLEFYDYRSPTIAPIPS